MNHTSLILPVEDPALPGLEAIRTVGLAAVIPALGGGAQEAADLQVLAHKPGKRAALEARVGGRRFIVKLGAKDLSEEAALHRAFFAAGLAGDSGDRVPRLLAHDRRLHVLVLGFLEGCQASHLLRNGQGERAAELAARWLRRMAALPLKVGSALGPETVLQRARKWIEALGAAEAALGRAALAVAGRLARRPPPEQVARLLHGSFHDRNVLDLGDAVGVIDWQRFRQGPTEFDAGTFLASITRAGLGESGAQEATRAQSAFLEGIAGLVEERTLAWYRAMGLLCLADRVLTRRKGDWLARAGALVSVAARIAAAIA